MACAVRAGLVLWNLIPNAVKSAGGIHQSWCILTLSSNQRHQWVERKGSLKVKKIQFVDSPSWCMGRVLAPNMKICKVLHQKLGCYKFLSAKVLVQTLWKYLKIIFDLIVGPGPGNGPFIKSPRDIPSCIWTELLHLRIHLDQFCRKPTWQLMALSSKIINDQKSLNDKLLHDNLSHTEFKWRIFHKWTWFGGDKQLLDDSDCGISTAHSG